jgi:hypothetical protein
VGVFLQSFYLLFLSSIMAPFTLSQLKSTPTPEPEARAPAHAKGMSTVEARTETPTERLLKGWAIILQSLEACMMAAPDHKPELLEDQEVWMREWVSMKVSALDLICTHFCTYASLSEQSRGVCRVRN